MKRAFITGITGQDGSYLAELLLSQDYEVHGLVRRASSFNRTRIEHIYHDPDNENSIHLHLHYGDVTDMGNLIELIHGIQPDEIYHLAAQSHVKVSFELAEYTSDVTGLGTMRVLEAIRKSGIKTRFYQASSSEMFGCAKPPQNELTAFEPQSPYAVAKVYAYWMTRSYRQGYQMYAANGILLTTKSPRRGETFVTRKITHALAAIKANKQEVLFLGNLDARRDWGYAPDYVAAMWKMLQCDRAGDYVIGTGEAHSVREFLDEAFGYLNMDWHDHVKIDPHYYRPNEVDFLQADPQKARRDFNWEPRVLFRDLVRIMVDADLELIGLKSPGEGAAIIEKHHGAWHRWNSQVVSMG